MREGEEIKNIPKHIKENCNDFKSYKDIKLKYELLFSIKNILTKV
jgi:hypothetical protein